MSVNVENTMSVYEVDGTEPTGAFYDWPKLRVRSHWNISRLVVLEFNGKRVTVDANDLKAAIRNASNRGDS